MFTQVRNVIQRIVVYISPRLLSNISFILFAKCWCVFPVNKVLLSWYSYQDESIWTWHWHCDLAAVVALSHTHILQSQRSPRAWAAPASSLSSQQPCLFVCVSWSYSVSRSRPVVLVSLELDAKGPSVLGLEVHFGQEYLRREAGSAQHICCSSWGCPSSLG